MADVTHKIEKLRGQIRHHDHLYYVLATPDISDLEYDKLLDQLKKLEEDHPELITPDSPTQRIGDRPVSELKPVTHSVPMMSIDNTYSEEDLRKYMERIQKLVPETQIEWVVELKIDGVALALVYEDGQLVRAATRGDGKVGDDITHNVRTMKDVPLRLAQTQHPKLLEVRGEAYMTNSELVRLNQEQTKRGDKVYANTRNVTAGSIRLLDPRECAQRELRFFAHGAGPSQGIQAKTHMEFLAEIQHLGIAATPHVAMFKDAPSAVAHCEELVETLHALDFEVDGLVIKVNQFALREKLGATSKSPRWVIAYKFEKYEAVTRLEKISVQVGKTGAITPVAELKPVELAQTTVSRASLHNFDEIERKDVREGDLVVVEKAGKIIPHIVRVEKHERTEELKKFQTPTHCPECNTAVVKDEGGVYVRCPNSNCAAQVRERIRYFATRGAMDIEGLGDKLVDQLVRHQLVTSYADLYRLTADKLMQLERMGRKSSESLVAAIESSKTRGLARLLNALSIRHVGARVATVLANHFDVMDKLLECPLEDLSKVNEIGPVIAKSVHDFLHGNFGQQTLTDLKELGLLMENTIKKPAHQPFAGKSFVVTGTLQTYSRDAIENLITHLGGRASGSVSKKTDYVVVGEDAGSKAAKAKELGVPILTEAEFKAMAES